MAGLRLLLSMAIVVASVVCGTSSPAAAADGLSLPEGAALESAALELDLIRFDSPNASETILVHRITKDWDEMTVTWNNFAGSYDPVAAGSFAADGTIGPRSVDVTSLVADWLSGAQPNYGFLLRQETIDSGTSLRFSEYASSESTAVSRRPRLVLRYRLPDGTSGEMRIQRGTSGEVADAYIWEGTGRADGNHGSAATLFVGVVYNTEKQSLLRFELPTLPPPPPCAPGTGTPGYWMNHPEAWPVDEIAIGGIAYARDDAIALIKAPVKKDKTLTMFAALVAAKLNVLAGNESSCIDDEISAADAWMAAHPAGSGLPAKDRAWRSGESLYLVLDLYNNGALCAPSRDALEP